jgi:dephospho-CoA kinase
MRKIGVTGGIGSGKSLVCELFAEMGVPVYYSDSRAKELVNGGGQLRDKIIALLGPESYRGDRMNRRFIADKIFADKMLLASLNGIVHPAVAEDFVAWTMSKTIYPYVLLESAILFESGFDVFVDEVITVSAPVKMRVERVVSRDGISRAEVMERMANQLTDEERQTRADHTIYNDKDIEQMAVSVCQFDKMFRQ